MYSEALPPHDDQAEEATLGALLIDGESIARVVSVVDTGDFFRQKHAWVYEACLALFGRDRPINQVSVADELQRLHRLDETGGMAFLVHLEAMTPTSVYAEHYAGIVRRMSVMRQVINASGRIADMGQRAEMEEAEVLAACEDILYQIRAKRNSYSSGTAADAVNRYKDTLGLGKTPGVKTGFSKLDFLLHGLQPGHLYVLASRPGVGKSALATQIADHVASHKDAVAFFSLEMDMAEIVERMVARRANLDPQIVRNWQANEEQAQRVVGAQDYISTLPIVFEDAARMDVLALRGAVKRHDMEQHLALVIVDYMQLLRGHGLPKGSSREQEVSQISRELKAISREVKVPVLALSQLNRDADRGEPTLANLRESGSIEQDADVVLFLWHKDEEKRTQVTLRVAKNRAGGLGSVQLQFTPHTTSFVEV